MQIVDSDSTLKHEILGFGPAEEALRESEEKYRTLVENSLLGLAIIQDLRIVFCNHTYAAFLGYTVDEVLSMPQDNVLEFLDTNDRLLLLRRHRDRLAGKDVPNRYEHKAIKRDGTAIWVDACISLTEYQGKPAVLATYIDITDRKEAERKIQTGKDHLDAVLNHISDPIFVMDREHRIIHINDAGCAFSGMRREDVLGMSTHEHIPKEQGLAMWQAEEDVFNSGKEIVSEDNLPDAQGTMHSMIVKKSLLIDRNGNKQLVGVARDVTEYKNLHRQLLQAQKMEAIGTLAGGIANDFNSLLSIIKGYVDLVLEERASDKELQQDLGYVLEACKKGAILTNQLSAFDQNRKHNSEIINIAEIVQGMLPVIQRLIGEAICLEIKSDPELRYVFADPGQIQQIVTNLVVNAQAAMPEGGKLIVEIANINFVERQAGMHPGGGAGAYVLLAVADDGIGMDDTVKAHLFEPFFTTKGEANGTGLGLSTVYGIVKHYNGFIDVESEMGKGTKFLVYFPCES